jgi:hypothetical protein
VSERATQPTQQEITVSEPTDNVPARVDASPMGLIQMAVEQNADPDRLEKLMALQERWQANNARAAYNTAMQAAQAEMPVVVKDKENSHTRSKYAAFETVQKQCKPVYTRHGMSVSFDEQPTEREGWVRVRAVVQHVDGHAETFFRDGPMDNVGAKGNATKSALHGVTSTMTYLERHLLCGIFSITVADHDNDGGGMGATISAKQAKEAEALMGQLEKDTVARFMGWVKQSVGADAIEDIPAARFPEVVKLLEAKVKTEREQWEGKE